MSEDLQFYQLGIDGLFSDFADTAVASRFLFQILMDLDAAECLMGDPQSRRRACR